MPPLFIQLCQAAVAASLAVLSVSAGAALVAAIRMGLKKIGVDPEKPD